MRFLRSLEDWEVKRIFEVQRYLDSMEKIDAEKRKIFHNMQRQFARGYRSFQDIARREMAKQNKRSVTLGMKNIREMEEKYAEQSRISAEAETYAEKIKNMNVWRNVKRYVFINTFNIN